MEQKELEKLFLEGIARQLGIPKEQLTPEFISDFRKRLQGEDGSPSIIKEEQQDREAREFLAQFVEGEEREALLKG